MSVARIIRQRHECSVRQFEIHEAQPGFVVRGRLGRGVYPHHAVHAAEKKPVGIGTFPVSVVAELDDAQIGRGVVVEKVMAGAVLREALVRAQPDAAVRILQHAVYHVVDDAVAAVELPDVTLGRKQYQPRTGAAVESRLAALAQAEQIAQGPALQAVHINKYVLLRPHVEAYQPVTAAHAQQQRRVAFAYQGIKLIAVAALQPEPVTAHRRHDGPVALSDCQFDQRIRIAGEVERRVVHLAHLVDAAYLRHSRLQG